MQPCSPPPFRPALPAGLSVGFLGLVGCLACALYGLPIMWSILRSMLRDTPPPDESE